MKLARVLLMATLIVINGAAQADPQRGVAVGDGTYSGGPRSASQARNERLWSGASSRPTRGYTNSQGVANSATAKGNRSGPCGPSC